MLFYSTERTSLFIDGYHFHNTCRALDIEVDFDRLHKFFSTKFVLVHANFYTTISPDLEENSNLKPLLDWLAHNGYNVITKPRREGKLTKMDIDIVVDVWKASVSGIDHIVLFTGDSSLLPTIKTLHDMGKRVTAVSTIKLKPSPINDEMRKSVDNFVDVAEIAEHIKRLEKTNG